MPKDTIDTLKKLRDAGERLNNVEDFIVELRAGLDKEDLNIIRQAIEMLEGGVDVEALIDDFEVIVGDTWDVDVTDRHFAENIADHIAENFHLINKGK